MKFQLTKEQTVMQKLVHDFAQKEIVPFVKHMEAGVFPREIITKMADRGLMGIPIPKKYHGAGMDFLSYVLTIQELSKVSATIGVILSVHTSVGTNPIVYAGTEEQKQKYVTKLASGQYLGAFCLTEPGAGSDAANIQTRAIRTADHYVLNGTKAFITNGGEADIYIVFARTGPTKGRGGISAFIVERTMPGLVIGKDERKMGLNGSRTVQLTFDEMKIPAENLLGAEGEGFKLALANLNIGRIGIAAQALGIAEAAYTFAVKYVKMQKMQDVSLKLADMATAVESSKLLVYYAADLSNRGIPCAKKTAIAKLFASKTAVEVTTEAMQIVGSFGYTKECPLERYFRDAKITEIYEGTSEIQRIVISKHLLRS